MDKEKSARMGKKEQLIDKIARELHFMLAYSTITAIHTLTKINNPELEPEEREKEINELDRIINLAETLYEDLDPKIQEIYKQQAKTLL